MISVTQLGKDFGGIQGVDTLKNPDLVVESLVNGIKASCDTTKNCRARVKVAIPLAESMSWEVIAYEATRASINIEIITIPWQTTDVEELKPFLLLGDYLIIRTTNYTNNFVQVNRLQEDILRWINKEKLFIRVLTAGSYQLYKKI